MPLFLTVIDFDEVILIAGGEKNIAAVCGVGVSTISERRKKSGLFSASWERAINKLLEKYELRASTHLFDHVGTKKQPLDGKAPRWSEARRLEALKKYADARAKYEAEHGPLFGKNWLSAASTKRIHSMLRDFDKRLDKRPKK